MHLCSQQGQKNYGGPSYTAASTENAAVSPKQARNFPTPSRAAVVIRLTVDSSANTGAEAQRRSFLDSQTLSRRRRRTIRRHALLNKSAHLFGNGNEETIMRPNDMFPGTQGITKISAHNSWSYLRTVNGKVNSEALSKPVVGPGHPHQLQQAAGVNSKGEKSQIKSSKM